MALEWGERLIASGNNATRAQLAAVADLIGHFPSVALLPTLKGLLDDELRRYRSFRKQAEASAGKARPRTKRAQSTGTGISSRSRRSKRRKRRR